MILEKNKELLHAMASALLEYETIDSKDISKLLDGKKIIRRLNGKNKNKNSKPSHIKNGVGNNNSLKGIQKA